MLRDTVAVAVAVAVVRTRPRAIPLAMITMRKSIHGFPLISIYGMLMGLRLAALRVAGAPLVDGAQADSITKLRKQTLL